MWELIGKIAVGYFVGAGVTFATMQSQSVPSGNMGDALTPVFNIALSTMWPLLLAGAACRAVLGHRE